MVSWDGNRKYRIYDVVEDREEGKWWVWNGVPSS